MKSGHLPFVTDIPDVRGKHVIVRSSLNVPIENGVVQNYFRIMRAMPTLLHLTHSGAKVILIGHVGRDPKNSTKPLLDILGEHLDITFVPSVIGSDVTKAITEMAEGSVVMLENIRAHAGETVNDPELSKTLASYADLYVNDAFAASHRSHASIVGIPKYIKGYFGLTFREEYVQLMKAADPISPALLILGGAKFETKEPLVEKYIKKYNHVFVGGALANDFFKAKGFEVGKSLVSKKDFGKDPLLKHKKILLPIDVTVQEGSSVRVTTPEKVKSNEKILDAGPKTMEMLKPHIMKAHSILWNGPLGDYEHGFVECTKTCAKFVAESEAHSIVGGGDTTAAIEPLALHDQFSFISTAGGAMLVFLEEGNLVGIEAVLKSHT